jgi:hypothetical protein
MGLFAKTGSTTWSTTKKVFAKTSTGGWSAITSVWAKVESGWLKVWPKIAPAINAADPINIRLNSYNGTVATGYMYIDTILYGHDGLFDNGPATASDRKFVASTSVNLSDIISGDVETTAPLDVFNLSNNTDTTRNRIDGNYLFYQLKATNNQDPTLFSILNGPQTPIKIIKKTPSITSTVFTEYGDGIYQMEFYVSSKWYDSPDLANSYIRWWKHTDKVNYRNGTILQTDYFSTLPASQKYGTGWTDGSSTSPDLNGLSMYATSTIPPNGTYIIAEVVLKNSFTTHFSTEVTSVKSSGVLPFIRNVRFVDQNDRDPTDYLNRLITDGLWNIKFDVDNVTSSTTYRVDFRLYDVSTGIYYNFSTGTSFTNGTSWPTQSAITGSLSGSTAAVTSGLRSINTAIFPAAAHTYGGGQVRYRLGFRLTAQTPGQQRVYFTGVVNNNGGPYVLGDTGGEFDLNHSSVLTFSSSTGIPAVNDVVTFSGTTASYPSGYNSYPRQWKIDFGDGTDSGWVNFNGTANPGFSTTKSYTTAGTYAATLFWTPQGDKSRSTSTQISIVVSNPPVNTSAPTLEGTNLSPGGVLNFNVGSWTNSPTSYTVRIYRGTANVATSETLVSTQTLTAPTTTGTYTITQEDYTNTGISPVRRYLRVFVTANNGTNSVQKSGGEVGPVTPPSYTITWKMNDGTSNDAGTASTFTAGGSVTAPSPTRANYVLDRFTETTSGTYLLTVLPGASWSPPSANRTMYARWTYSPPSYTFVFGNKISVSTNGYISIGSSGTVGTQPGVIENKTTTAAATSGKVIAILPHDARQTSLYYFSDTTKYVVKWTGATYNVPSEVMAYEITFYKDQQYADLQILNRTVFQQSNAAYMVDAYTGSGVITSYPSTPTELSKWRVYFNGTTPITPITYSALSTSVMIRDTTNDGVDDNTTTLTTATNQTSYIAPHFPPFFPPHFPPFFPPFFPPHFPPFFPPHFPPFFPPHFPPFFPPYFATPTLPAVPTGLAASNDGSNTSLTWNAATGATSYEIFYWSGSTYTGTARDFFGITGTSYSHATTSLWYYFVRSRNAAGVSAYSPGVLATSTFTPPYFPGPPGGY